MAATPDEHEQLEHEPEPDSRVSQVDEAGRESFPASDPPASWAGPDVIPEQGDESPADGRERRSRPAGA